MAKCPKGEAGWAELVQEMQGNRIKAYSAFLSNGGKVPALDSEIVKRIKSFNLDFGKKMNEEVDADGKSTGYYIEEGTGKRIKRATDDKVGFTTIFKPFKRTKERVGTYGEELAKKLFEGLNEDDKLLHREAGKEFTQKEYAKYVDGAYEASRIKGLAIHRAIQAKINPNKAAELEKETKDEIDNFEAEYGDEYYLKWEWVKAEGVIEQMFENANINLFKEYQDPNDDVIRDMVESEVKVNNDILGFGGTMDLFIQKANGKYQIIDIKTGKTHNPVNEDMGMLLMKYGDTATKEVLYNNINSAKLQVMFYALMNKINNPDMQFEGLSVLWAPNKFGAKDKDSVQNIDVSAYLSMMQSFLKNKAALKEAGIDENVYEKIIAKSPNAFNPKHYSSKSSEKLTDEITGSKESPEAILAKKMQKLQAIIGKKYAAKEFTEDEKMALQGLTYAEKQEVFDLQKDIMLMLSSGTVDMYHNIGEGISSFVTYFGNFADVNSPALIEYKRFYDKQILKRDMRKDELINKMHSLLRPIQEDAIKNSVGIGGTRVFNYDKVFGKFIITSKSKTSNTTEERLLHKDDTDPELKNRYDALTVHEKAFLDFYNDTMKSLFDENSYLGSTAFEEFGKSVTHLDLYNRSKNTDGKFDYKPGFFFKVPMENREVAQRFGVGKAVKQYFKENTSFFIEDQFYRESDNVQAIPIRFLGNDYINNSRMYTHNLEIAFINGIDSALNKEYLDQVFALGSSMSAFLKQGQSRKDILNLATFLDMKIFQNLQRKSMRTTFQRRRISLGNGYAVSADKVFQMLMKWTSMSIMWLKPIQAAGNFFHANTLTHREGLRGSILSEKKWFDQNFINFTESDKMKAEGLYFSTVKDTIFDDLRKNKMLLFARKFNYLGNNYDYSVGQSYLMTKNLKGLDESLMYFAHSKTEEFVSLTTMTAQLLHMKTPNGTSLWDSYTPVEIGNGVYDLVYTGETRGTVKRGDGATAYYETLTGLTSEEISKLKRTHEKMQGGYRKDEAGGIEIYVLGRMMVQLKKFLPRLILNLFHGKKVSTDFGYFKPVVDNEGNVVMRTEDGKTMDVLEWHSMVEEGRINSLVKAFKHMIGNKEVDINESTIENLAEAALTGLFFIITYGMYLLMFGGTDDDDTMKKFWKRYMVDNLSQQYNIKDLFHTVSTTFTPVSIAQSYKIFDSFMTFSVASANYAIGNDDAAFTQRGDLKGWNTFKKGLPLISSYTDFKSKIQNVKGDYGSGDGLFIPWLADQTSNDGAVRFR
jgi:hypothetical protein